ncbi:MAG: DNA topology modulation protein [Candidatus Cloacimonetes bacterium]|nr:DNA topology modulation protein [Candidatus Cloacimonadota bacterium]MCK4359736.1 DNA topology modulation protein [Candidatus Cloacimonadota bacterium]
MNKILILGSSGSGKSTFAKKLGELLNIEVVHLDLHYWKPNWINTPREEWKEKLKVLLQKDCWIMDGNYASSLDLRLKHADTVIFLNSKRFFCLWRCFKRFVKFRGRVRSDLAVGCYEKFDLEFFKWIWNYPKDIKPHILKMLENVSQDKKIIRLNCNKEVNDFLRNNVEV